MYSYPDFSQQGYQVISELGRNREGGRIAWLATDLNQGQQVVLKQFCFAIAGSNWSAYNAHKREIEVLQKLDHPGIPRYLGAFETPNGFCLVQEYKNAPTLAAQRSFEPSEIKQIAVKILEILVYLQNQIPFVIHRDIKPENILVDEQLKVYLIDFGMSRLGSEEISGSSVFKGTPGFMPPEQMRKPTEASDLYGLGVTLICLLTGINSTAIHDLTDNNDPYKINFRHSLPQLNQRFLNWLELMVQPRLNERFSNAKTALEALISLGFIGTVEDTALEGQDLEFRANSMTHSQQSWECVQVVPGISGSGSIALSPNQDILATLGGTVIHLFEVNTGQLIRTITDEHSKWLGNFAFSPNGLTLASVVCDSTFKTPRTIKLWEILTGKEILTLTDHSNIHHVSFNPNGRILASQGWSETIKLWDVRTGQELRTLILPSDSKGGNFLTFNRDGRILATGDGDMQKTIKLWDVHTGRELRTLTGHSHPVYCIDFSPNGKTLATGGRDKTVKLWDVETGSEICTLNNGFLIYSLTFSPDGKTLAIGSFREGNNYISLWDVETGSEICTMTNLPGDVQFVAFSQNGQTLISGYDDGTIKLWKLQTDRRQKIIVRDVGNLLSGLSSVASVAFNPDGQIIVSNSSGRKLLQIPTDRQQNTIVREIRPSFSVDKDLGALSPDGETVAIATFGDYFRIYYELRSVQTGEEIRVLPPGHREKVSFAAFSPDGQVFASGSSDGTIKVWDVETGRELCALTELSEMIVFIALSPDRRTLASISGGGIKIGNSLIGGETIKLWDIETGSEICTLTGHSECVYSVAFSPDEQTIATASRDGTVKLWDVETGSEICTLTGHSESVYSVAFSPDKRTIASGSGDGTIKLWNIETGSEICTLHHFGAVLSIAFSFNGRTLAAAAPGGNIKIWQQTQTNLEAFTSVDTNRKPEIYLRPSVLKFQTTRLSEKLTQTITIENPIPNTMLEGRWEVASHPQDPPHTPDAHAWISLEPIEFIGNSTSCHVHINISKLLADKLYERHLLLHTNAYPEVRHLTVRVKTAPLPIERREISYVEIVVTFLISLVTSLFEFFAFSSFGTLMGVGSVVLMGVGSVVGFHGGKVWALRVSYAVSGLSVALPVASFLVMGLTVGIFTLKYISPLVVHVINFDGLDRFVKV